MFLCICSSPSSYLIWTIYLPIVWHFSVSNSGPLTPHTNTYCESTVDQLQFPSQVLESQLSKSCLFDMYVTKIERVTGRKARGLQMEEIACKCQTFLSLLRGRRKLVIFFPSLYKFKRRFLLKYRVAIMTPGFT